MTLTSRAKGAASPSAIPSMRELFAVPNLSHSTRTISVAVARPSKGGTSSADKTHAHGCASSHIPV